MSTTKAQIIQRAEAVWLAISQAAGEATRHRDRLVKDRPKEWGPARAEYEARVLAPVDAERTRLRALMKAAAQSLNEARKL